MKAFWIICGFLFPMSAFFADETILVMVPISINGQMKGEVEIILDIANDRVCWVEEALDKFLAAYLNERGKKALQNYLEKFPTTSVQDSHEWGGMILSFEEKDQSVLFTSDPSYFKQQKHRVKYRFQEKKVEGVKKVYPANFSGYINAQGGTRHTRSYFSNFQQPKNASYGNFDWAMNLNDWVFQGFAYFLGSLTEGVNRGNAVLSHDLPDLGMRVSMGMINPFGMSFLATKPMIGLNIDRNYSLFTDATVGPVNREEIFLNAASRVEIYLDGLLVKTMDLDAGSHSLQDFPLVEGLNEVQLKIYGPTGDERVIDLSYFYNPQFLALGKSSFNSSIGWVNYNPEEGARGYFKLPSLPMVNAIYRVGITDTATVGSYLQATFDELYSGTECNISNQLFKSTMDFGISYTEEQRTQFRTRVGFYKPVKSTMPFNWKCVFDYTGKYFTYLDDSNAAGINFKEFIASGSVDAYLAKNLSVGLLGEWAKRRIGMNSYYAQFNGAISLGKTLLLKFIGRVERLSTGKFEKSAAFNLELLPRYKDVSLRTNYNSQQKTIYSGVTYDRDLGQSSSVHAALGYSQAPKAKTGEGMISFSGQRASIKASHYLAKTSFTDADSTVAISTVSGGTALAFAGKALAISKPIKQSFVIIAPNKYLRHTPLLVNPTTNGYEAKARYYFPAAIELRPYREQYINIGGDEVTNGPIVETETYAVKPTYKSGCLISMGEPPTFVLEGKLRGKDKEPLAKEAGILISRNGEIILPFVTDLYGNYQVVGISSGTYKFKLISKEYVETFIEIQEPDRDTNFITLPDITLEERVYKKEKKWNTVSSGS